MSLDNTEYGYWFDAQDRMLYPVAFEAHTPFFTNKFPEFWQKVKKNKDFSRLGSNVMIMREYGFVRLVTDQLSCFSRREICIGGYSENIVKLFQEYADDILDNFDEIILDVYGKEDKVFFTTIEDLSKFNGRTLQQKIRSMIGSSTSSSSSSDE